MARFLGGYALFQVIPTRSANLAPSPPSMNSLDSLNYACAPGEPHPFGISVCSPGDLNDDGFPDIAIASYLSSSGEIFVYLGGAGRIAGTFGASDAEASYTSDDGPVRMPSVCRPGDLNSDGIRDLVMVDYEADTEGGNDAGVVYVVLGSRGLSGAHDLDSGASDGSVLAFDGGFAYDKIETATFVGDFDGDGLDDLAIGGGETSGTAYVVYGSPSWSGRQDLDDTPELGEALALEAPASEMTKYIVPAGDLDSDGCDDLLVSAWGYAEVGDKTSAYQRGGAYVVYGQGECTGAARMTGRRSLEGIADPEAADPLRGVLIVGEVEGDYTGSQVSGAGDLDGDGRGDLLLMSNGHENPPVKGEVGFGLAYGVLSATLPGQLE